MATPDSSPVTSGLGHHREWGGRPARGTQGRKMRGAALAWARTRLREVPEKNSPGREAWGSEGEGGRIR